MHHQSDKPMYHPYTLESDVQKYMIENSGVSLPNSGTSASTQSLSWGKTSIIWLGKNLVQ